MISPPPGPDPPPVLPHPKIPLPSFITPPPSLPHSQHQLSLPAQTYFLQGSLCSLGAGTGLLTGLANFQIGVEVQGACASSTVCLECSALICTMLSDDSLPYLYYYLETVAFTATLQDEGLVLAP